MSDLIVPRRFCGPPDSGNGGWTAGALATHEAEGCPTDRSDSWPAIEVTLRQPPPLDTVMDVEVADGQAVASHEGAVVASARIVETELLEIEPVDAQTAQESGHTWPGHTFHPFPTCFVCGSERDKGDGLRIWPGRVADSTSPDGAAQARVAAVWTPDASLSEDWHTYVDDHQRASAAATWASLDCIGAWAGDFGERLMVLGRMTARIDALPVIGEPHVVMGEARGTEGRKTFTAATLYDADGRVVGTAEHTWIQVDPEKFGGRTAQ